MQRFRGSPRIISLLTYHVNRWMAALNAIEFTSVRDLRNSSDKILSVLAVANIKQLLVYSSSVFEATVSHEKF